MNKNIIYKSRQSSYAWKVLFVILCFTSGLRISSFEPLPTPSELSSSYKLEGALGQRID